MTDQERLMAVCQRCGSAYAAKKLEDGRIRPIGRERCSCGSDEFEPIE